MLSANINIFEGLFMLGLKDAIIIAGRRYMMPFIDKKYSITHRSYHQPGLGLGLIISLLQSKGQT